MQIGDTISWERTFTETDIREFTRFSGDAGEHHLVPDEHGRLMAHRLLTATLPTKIGGDLNGHRLLLRVNPDIARALKEEESAVLKDLRQSIGKEVTIKADTQLHHEQFDVMAEGDSGRGQVSAFVPRQTHFPDGVRGCDGDRANSRVDAGV